MVLNPPFFISFKIDSIYLVGEKIEMVFPCYEILYLYFESLGLDITSLIVNTFKMAATYLFHLFISKNQTNGGFPHDIRFIEKVLSIPIHFTFFWILSISLSKIYLRSSFNLFIDINPRSLPL